jgi:hypothetical protein
MSKKRNRQKQRAAKTVASGSTTSPTTPLTLRSRFVRWWGKPLPKWWVLGLGLLTIGTWAYNFRPRLDVIGAVPLDEHDPLATDFLIQNTGPWSVYNVRFGCEVSIGQQHISVADSVVVNSPQGQSPIEQLSHGGQATRDCLVGPQSHFIQMPVPDPTAVQIDVVVKYHWPFDRFVEFTAAQHFSVRRSPNQQKLLLVPDTK